MLGATAVRTCRTRWWRVLRDQAHTLSRSSGGWRSSQPSGPVARCSGSATWRGRLASAARPRIATSRRSPGSATSIRIRRRGSTASVHGCSTSGFSAINSMDLRELAVPHLQALSDETGHTVNMAVLDGADIVYIERCRTSRQGQRDIDLNLHVGSRLPAYCTSMGKVLLAHLTNGALETCSSRTEFHTARPEHADGAGRAARRARARPRRTDSRSTTRSSPTAGADRRTGALAVGRGRRRDQPRGAPLDGLLRRAARAARLAAAPDRGRDLGPDRLRAGACVKPGARGGGQNGNGWPAPPWTVIQRSSVNSSTTACRRSGRSRSP